MGSPVPWIREAVYGENMGLRAKAIHENSISALGPSDLFHWGRYYGEKSSTYLKNPFSPIDERRNLGGDQEGYVGFYHHVNGVELCGGDGEIGDGEIGEIGEMAYNKLLKEVEFILGEADMSRENVVTICMYNPFLKQEMRGRFIIVGESKKNRQKVSESRVSVQFTVTSNKKMHTYSRETLGQLGGQFFRELAVANLARAFLSVDNVAHQISGTRNVDYQVKDPGNLMASLERMVEMLPKGAILGCDGSYGVASACGSGEKAHKTSRYRNRLIDSIIRLVLLDDSGELAEKAIEMIRDIHGPLEFAAVEARLLVAQHGRNNDQRFLSLVRGFLAKDSSSTQAAILILMEVRFLIAKGAYFLARTLASKAVALLPLDFDAWLSLCLCYILEKDYDSALNTLNSLPVMLLAPSQAANGDLVDGILDSFAQTFVDRSSHGVTPVPLDTFESFFPEPPCKTGKVRVLWSEMFRRRESIRHPIAGPFFQLPLATASTMEMAAVDYSIVAACKPTTPKHMLAARSAGVPWASVVDFDRRSTWGRAYDVLTLLAAVIGWENLVGIKGKVFRPRERPNRHYQTGPKDQASVTCSPWLELLFAVVLDDIRTMAAVSGAPETDHPRSALSWSMMGLLGWSTKYNLKESISALATSVVGAAADGGFDYFATVKLLEIYNEFVLSDVAASTIDPLACAYDNHSFTNKLIVQSLSAKVYRDFVAQLTSGYLSLHSVLLHVMKLASWERRWHSNIPSFLVLNTLIKLCHHFDPVQLRTELRLVFESHKSVSVKKSTFWGLKLEEKRGDFYEGDDIVSYLENIISDGRS